MKVEIKLSIESTFVSKTTYLIETWHQLDWVRASKHLNRVSQLLAIVELLSWEWGLCLAGLRGMCAAMAIPSRPGGCVVCGRWLGIYVTMLGLCESALSVGLNPLGRWWCALSRTVRWVPLNGYRSYTERLSSEEDQVGPGFLTIERGGTHPKGRSGIA